MANCLGVRPPKINPELKASASEAALKRDARLASKQAQVGACLSAVGKSLSLLLERDNDEENHQLIEVISDTGRLLSDIHFSESTSRRILLSSNLNKKFKDAVEDAPIDDFLFGTNLEDRLKAAKSLERSGLELARTPVPTKKPLNFKRPFRQPHKPSQQDGRRYVPARKPFRRSSHQYQKDRSRPKSGPTRNH